MIGIVIPAHNEAALIDACLAAVQAAGCHPELAGEAVEIMVVMDACDDGTADVVAAHPVQGLALSLRNVGAARAAGASALLERGARWLAFTDADTLVAPDWLVRQLELGADLVCGTVEVEDWSDHLDHAAQLKQHFRRTYNDAEGHRHVHFSDAAGYTEHLPPGAGELPLGPFLARLAQRGYAGGVSLELDPAQLPEDEAGQVRVLTSLRLSMQRALAGDPPAAWAGQPRARNNQHAQAAFG